MERPCGTCEGTGKTPLSPEYVRTLEVLEVYNRPRDLANILGINQSALTNRLTRMAAWGLVVKESRGSWRKT